MEALNLSLKQSTVESLLAFSEILKKDVNSILEEALEQYFEAEQQKLMEKNKEDENAMTNLDYNEFWDGVEID